MAEARRILSYFELPKKAQPPKSIWHSVKKCTDFVEKNLNPGDKKNSDGGYLEFSDKEIE